ncbi:shikimate dehydrogenase [Roseovarius sp. 10]|uniref:shikimate dehydrogenase family protein n=1 Tax=Roseovarius sp. 10 TaxID=3080563 RepID=UPI002955AF33|nr:shikimate dehydrogenase [Roseovarius sp. 10]MDV7202316.1 shikimate dehydrogenase [Roseovarius sp. 10]
MNKKVDIYLGLIGDNIAQSKAPLLHHLAGLQNGMSVQYDRLVPSEQKKDFDALFDACPLSGYRAINVTYPYKERAARKVLISDPLVRAMGAVNTVLFKENGPVGYNTDYSGFIAAYRNQRGDKLPGVACLIGTGGVGRALAFALIALGTNEIRLVDNDKTKADVLADDLRKVVPTVSVRVMDNAASAADGASGLLNGTPIGMVGYEGTPLPASALTGAVWAFDAVYTPVNTEFLMDAESRGLEVISGYELFFYQGVHAWSHFANLPLDENRLRIDLKSEGNAA